MTCHISLGPKPLELIGDKQNTQKLYCQRESRQVHLHALLSGLLTHVVRCVTGGHQGVVKRGLLCKTKVCQFEDGVSTFGGVQQVLRLVRRHRPEDK